MFGCSKEPSHWDGSFEYPQHMFQLRNKKNDFPFTHSYLEVWLTKENTDHGSHRSVNLFFRQSNCLQCKMMSWNYYDIIKFLHMSPINRKIWGGAWEFGSYCIQDQRKQTAHLPGLTRLFTVCTSKNIEVDKSSDKQLQTGWTVTT